MKRSRDRSRFTAGSDTGCDRKHNTASPFRRLSRFFADTVTAHTRSLIPNPANHRNGRVNANCSISRRSERIA